MELDEETIFKFQIFEQQINQINQQLEAVEQGILELVAVRQGLEEIENKKEQEILAPIGRGIFAKAKLLSNDLIVDVGDKKFVNKSISDTKKILEDQIKRLEEIKEELTDSLEEINEDLTQTMVEAQNKQKGCACGKEECKKNANKKNNCDECGCGDGC